jgi:hypothetical protein
MCGLMKSVALVLVVFTVAVVGQDTQGLLKGTVLDPRGGAVVGVTVEVRNQATGSIRSLTSNESGYFIAPNLQPGSYTITVTAPGFQKYVRSNIVLETSQPIEIPVRLAIGDVAQSITVVDDGLDVDTVKSDRTWTLRGDQLGELPMPDRNIVSVLTQVPGVNFYGPSDGRGYESETISYISVNGGSARMNAFQLDGAPNDVPFTGGNNRSSGMIGVNPSVDAVKEVKVITNVYDAQTGRTAGAVVQVSLKSGGEKFHGSAYEYAYRTRLEANTFQNNANGVARDRHTMDQTGYTFGGPVLIPKLFDGRKHRTFFFNSYEYFRNLAPSSQSVSVAEPDMLRGDFSRLTNSRGQLITIYDPASGSADASGRWVRRAFAGNVIPQARINPIMQKVLSYMPQPNQASATGSYSYSNLYLSGSASEVANYWKRLATKIDQEINDSHRFSFRFALDSHAEDSTENGLRGLGASSVPRRDFPRTYALNWYSSFNPKLFAELRTSFSSYQRKGNPGANYGFDKKTLGFPDSLLNLIPGGPYFGRYNFTGYVSLGAYETGWKSDIWGIGSNVTRVFGNHTVKMGTDFRWTYYNTQSLGNVLQYTFADVFTRADYSRADNLSGNSIATALLGLPTGGGSSVTPKLALLSKYFAGYVQDDWKVHRRLTLNLGFRYDLYIPVTERYNRIIANFDSSVTNPANALIDRSRFPDLPQLTGGLLFAGVNGQPRTTTDVWPGAVQPRFGFAYEVLPNIVMRGGFGRSYWSSQDDMYTQYGYALSTSLVASLDDNRTARSDSLINPFPSGMVPVTGNSKGLLTNLGQAVAYQKRGFTLPHIDQFSLGFQIKLPANSRLELGYVGSRTYDMRVDVPENEISLATRQKCNPLEGGDPAYCNVQLPNPFRNLEPFLGTSRYTSANLTRAVLLRPRPQFDAITGNGYNLGRGWYDAFQTIYEMRTAHGIVFNATYTFAKNMQLAGAGVGGNTFIKDVQKMILDRSPNFYNRPHIFTFAGVADLPFGRGKRLLGNATPVVRTMVSGWQLSSRFDLSSGILSAVPSAAFSVRNGVLKPNWHDPSGNVRMWRPCVARVLDQPGPVIRLEDRGLNSQFGCAIDNFNWLIPPQYSPEIPPNFLMELHRQPNLGLVNLALDRHMKIGERYGFDLRLDAYNVFNRYVMIKGIPDADPTSANFGVIVKKDVRPDFTAQPRKLCASLRFSF